jgi:N-acetylglucosaminyldiphosphoundecaprenol N-acetyl-beta-D-mannosaminyltransferase
MGFAVHQMQSHKQDDGELEVRCGATSREVILPLRLAGSVCHALKKEVHLAMFARQHLMVNMRDVQRVDADGLGCLMEARRLLDAQGLSLWLTELPPKVMRVMEYSAVRGLFQTAETTRDAQLSSMRVQDRGMQFVRKAGRAVRSATPQTTGLAWSAYPERRVGS